jgi:catechol 2,3-dioxygenase-like lactoylglutathione lyase family enzyme
MTEWFARPVLHVSNVETSLRFYVDRLGFTVPWRGGVGADGRADVAQVEAVDALRAELEARGVTVKDAHWGYRVLVVEDLDGNQLFVPYPNEPGVDPEGLSRARSPKSHGMLTG